jgi:hypothetical protein
VGGAVEIRFHQMMFLSSRTKTDFQVAVIIEIFTPSLKASQWQADPVLFALILSWLKVRS